MDRDSFVMHRNFLEGIPEQEQFKWFKCICSYAFDNEEPKFENWLEEKIWIHIKDRIECDREAYDKRVEYQKRYYERKKGKNNSTVENIENVDNVENVKNFENIENVENFENFDNVYLESRRNTVSESEFKSESVSVSDTESVSESEFKREGNKSSLAREKKISRIPTDEEVRAYVSEKGYTFNVDKLLNHYQANGWKQSSGAPIKDWKAAVRQWNLREEEFAPKQTVFETPSHVDYNSPDWQQEDW